MFFFTIFFLFSFYFFFFFNDTATTEIYTLSLHDALPISASSPTYTLKVSPVCWSATRKASSSRSSCRDRKSTRLNSSHPSISYAVFCLKKKKKKNKYKHFINIKINIAHQVTFQQHINDNQ